ncbi:MAG: hypothetical protein ACLUVF_06445 [Adlercreutzia sp.]
MEPTAKNPDPHHIFIDEVQGHQRRWLKVIQFTSSSTKAAAIMLARLFGPRYRELAVLRAL